MPEIRSLDFISKKWAKVAAQSSDEYSEGVKNPRRSWEAGAIAAKEAYVSGVQDSISRGAWEKGIENAGDEKWARKTIAVGPRRYSEGVRNAESDYKKGFDIYHSVIANTDLPPRGPKGSPENIERVRVIAEALHNAKINQ